jgi:hypothetical protein
VRQQQRFTAHAGSRQRSLSAGMATANHNDIKFVRIQHEILFWQFAKFFIKSAILILPPMVWMVSPGYVKNNYGFQQPAAAVSFIPIESRQKKTRTFCPGLMS